MMNPRSAPASIFSLRLCALAILLPTAIWNCGIAQAELKLASLFTDHAVLQQDQAIPVWGTADAEANVTVKFGQQNKTAVADSEGNWKVVLDAMPANANPQALQVADADSKISLADIVVGEVWICSGQSNMQMGYKQVPKIRALESSAKNLRVFQVKNTVAFTQQSDCEGQWKIEPPASAVAFAFAYHLEQNANVPIGIIQTSWGSSSLEAWMPRDMTETVPHFKTIMEEFDADNKTREQITSILNMPEGWKRQDDVFLRRQPNVLYNAMMHPLAPYGCRGLVWYQGERNTQSMFGMVKSPWFGRHSGMLKYGETLKAWIKRYRKQWCNDEMHFMIVMLPGYYKPGKPETGLKASDLGAEHPASHSWAWMRESQLAALDLPHTSVANTIDLGDVKNIHPKDKLPIGKRLALLAAKDALGKDVKAAGPMMKNVEVEGEQLTVHFDRAEGLRTTDQNEPTGFWLADDSGQWFPADAEIKDQSVVLRSHELTSPLYVRYAFAGKPQVNLVNAAELPAYPFRTDTFAP